MLSLGVGEMLLIAGVALVVIGPERLPFVMRQLGRWYGMVRRTADDLRRAFTLEADRQDAAERYKQLQERRLKAQEARRKAQEEAGGAAQPSAVESAAEAQPPSDAATDGELTPNDIAPDAPHPSVTEHRVDP